jgi:hypothetical protein
VRRAGAVVKVKRSRAAFMMNRGLFRQGERFTDTNLRTIDGVADAIRLC